MSYKFEISGIHKIIGLKVLIVDGKVLEGYIKTDTVAHLSDNESITYLVKGLVLGGKTIQNETLSLTLEVSSKTESLIKEGSILVGK